LQVHKTNVNKQHLFLALCKDFFTVSVGGSEVIAASLDRQFNDSADFTDLSGGSLDRFWMSKVRVTAGHRHDASIHIDAKASKFMI